MHDNFADWYRLASLEPDAPTLEKRWAVVERMGETIDASHTVGIAQLIFDETPAAPQSVAEMIREVAKEVDELFPMKDNDLEVRLLAASVAIKLLEGEPSQLATFAALRIVSSAFTRGPAVIAGITELSDHYLQSVGISERRRSIPASKALSRSQLEKDLNELSEVVSQNLLPPLADPLNAAFKSVASLAVRSAERSQAAVQEVARQLTIRDEELDILWWLFGKRSSILESSWGDVQIETAAMAAAWELANLTKIVPGPVGAKAFLEQVLVQSSGDIAVPIPIADAVVGLSSDQRKDFLEGASSPTFATPVTAHIAKSVDVMDDTAWRQAADSVGGIATGSVSPMDLSYQLYLERLQASLGRTD